MNSCFVSFDYILMFFSLFSDSAAFFLFHLFHLFWRANQLNSKNRRRFVSLVGHLWYFMGLSCKVECFHGERCPSCPHETARCEEGR